MKLLVDYFKDADAEAGQLGHVQPAFGIQTQIIGGYQVVRPASAIAELIYEIEILIKYNDP